MRNITRVRHNGYNLEVLIAIASLERYAMNTVINLARVEDYLVSASKAGSDHTKAVNLLVEASKLSEKIVQEQNTMWTNFTTTWNKSRLPKNESVGDKDYYHIQDDVKDHFADRRKGLDFMLAPFERIGIEDWRKQLNEIIHRFAESKNVPVSGLKLARLED